MLDLDGGCRLPTGPREAGVRSGSRASRRPGHAAARAAPLDVPPAATTWICSPPALLVMRGRSAEELVAFVAAAGLVAGSLERVPPTHEMVLVARAAVDDLIRDVKEALIVVTAMGCINGQDLTMAVDVFVAKDLAMWLPKVARLTSVGPGWGVVCSGRVCVCVCVCAY